MTRNFDQAITPLVRVFFGPKNYEGILFFDNPVTRWQYANEQNARPPNADVLLVKRFRSYAMAEGWLRGRSHDLVNVRTMVIYHE